VTLSAFLLNMRILFIVYAHILGRSKRSGDGSKTARQGQAEPVAQKGAQALERGIAILQYLERSGGSSSVSDISASLDLPLYDLSLVEGLQVLILSIRTAS
jgi:hypothetical protein